jgi:cytochrome c peroxidase
VRALRRSGGFHVKLLQLLVLAVVAGSCSHSATPPPSSSSVPAEILALAPAELPPPPADASNRFADDPRAIAFGHRLFFEKGFSGRLLEGDNDGSEQTLGMKGETGKVSCAGCHVPASGFLDDRTLNKQISLAAGWGRRRAPSLLDVAQASLLMWDGRRDALYNQPFGVIESPLEMNSSRLFAAQQVAALHRAEYEALFGALPDFSDTKRFPPLDAQRTGCEPALGGANKDPCPGATHGMPGDKAEYDGMSEDDKDAVVRVVANVGKALGAYERKLTCGASRFDRWARGKGELSASEQRGAALFVGKAACVSCHAGPFMSDQKFHNVGLRPTTVAVVFIDSDDHGAAAGIAAALADPLNVRGRYSDGDDKRLPAAVTPEMEGAFRTPSLRCVSRRPSFMHTGQLRTLEDVVAFFSKGGDPFGYPGKSELKPLDLTAADQADLVAFLRALDGPGPAADLLVPPAAR